MIFTVTFNPSIDYLIDVKDFALGNINRADGEIFVIGGKGINVSMILNNLGKDSVVTGFISGFTGEYIKVKLLECKYISNEFIQLDKGNSRINIKLNSIENNSKTETEINTSGPFVTNENYIKLYKKIEKLDKNDIIILSGSLAKGLDEKAYFDIAKICKTNKIKLVVDTSKKNLLEVCNCNPFLVKPNINELMEIFDVDIKNDFDVIKYGKELQNLGCENVLVSQGKDGAILLTKNKIYKSYAIKVIPKSTIGAGDSMVAGFIAEFERTNSFVESLKLATACSVATVCSNGIGTPDLIEKYLKEVKIQEIYV